MRIVCPDEIDLEEGDGRNRSREIKSWLDLWSVRPTYTCLGECETHGWTVRLFREVFDKSANEDTRGRGNEYEMRCS